MTKWITHWTTAFITAVVMVLVHYGDSTVVQTARLKAFDLLQTTDEYNLSQDVGIVAIDEAAIEKYGQWPWKRDVLSDIIWKLREAGAGIIVMPIIMSEPDRLGGDMDLAEALAGNGVVIAQTGSTQANRNAVPRGIAKIGDPLPYMFEWPGMLGPIPLLGENADGVGVLNTAPEIDGVVRRVPLLMRIQDDTYPALAVEVIRVATGKPSYQVKEAGGGIEAIRVPGYPIIKTDPNAQIWLRWNKEFQTISAASDDYRLFEGKTVIIGVTAEGIGGIVATPQGPQFNYIPSAVTLQTVIDGDQIQRPYWALLAELATTAVLGFLLVLLARFTPFYVIGAAIVIFSGGLIYGTLYAWQNYLYLLDVSLPLATVLIVGLHAVFNRFVVEFFEKQAIKKQFAGYASPTVVRLLQENPALIKDGMKKEVSICFSDLRGFTPLGESFGDDVKGLTKIMNGYMDAITQPILDADGMVIKYIGDASMHVHNAPIEDPHHPKTAVQCGLDMLKAVEIFNEKITSEGRPPVGMGAGINTGLGYLGEMGSTARHSYDVLGDSVSTAARIESKCKEYGCVLLVGDATYQRTKSDFFYLKIDDLAVKGKTIGITIWTVLDNRRPAWRSAQRKHEQMHEAYLAQKFDDAIELCNLMRRSFDGKMEGYYDMWIERCEFQKTQDLPKDWNGVFIATSK
ncbi:adenylate/guanylate cyclase domain-containing protein [bacterium]|nr:adenylate/guanylate cyclase domain-containing protein [bacterium]MDC1007327.1 adenylate/guanylate cyclase domain-containing protein [bacterium]